MEFNINGTVIPQVEKYDNQGAHNAIKSMMQRKETLSIMLQVSNTMSIQLLSNGYTLI